MRISDWSSDVCSSDLILVLHKRPQQSQRRRRQFLSSPSALSRGSQSASGASTGVVALDARVKPEHDSREDGAAQVPSPSACHGLHLARTCVNAQGSPPSRYTNPTPDSLIYVVLGICQKFTKQH